MQRQLYLFELFIDKVGILTESDKLADPRRKYIVRASFRNIQYIIKECMLAPSIKDDFIETDEDGRKKQSRYFRVGKTILFQSCPDELIPQLKTEPLPFDLWTDLEGEEPELIGTGSIIWHSDFVNYLRSTANICVDHSSLTLKTKVILYHECCCAECADIYVILRLSALGDCIETKFQQLLSEPDIFLFRSKTIDSTYQCTRIEHDDADYITNNSIYDSTVNDDPTIKDVINKKIEVCTDLQSCAVGQKGLDEQACSLNYSKPKDPKDAKEVRMGDIKGPCGNTSCPLANKVKTYIRNMDVYKKQDFTKAPAAKGGTRKICGKCDCKEDKWHREACIEDELRQPIQNPICPKCGGISQNKETCEQKKQKFYNTGNTPLSSKTHITQYLVSTTREPDALFRTDYIVNNVSPYYFNESKASTSQNKPKGCSCRNGCPSKLKPAHHSSSKYVVNVANTSDGSQFTKGNADSKTEQKHNFCLDLPDDKDCKCSPPVPPPACKTLDCDCIQESINYKARKDHQTFCPSYKHKEKCPVNDTEEEEKLEELEEETVPLPYGLPPIRLGPCPVIGRPCSVPDGFTRMYRTAAQAPAPPSYSDAGKVCCTKEFERVKKAIKQYIKRQKENDMRCITRYMVDTERRCCDKEATLQWLMGGKSCCGAHKKENEPKK